jgi:hypothetical protein
MPGLLRAQDHFYIGTLKDVSRIYQQSFLDAYAKLAFAKLYDCKTPLVAADLLDDRVIAFFDEYPDPAAARVERPRDRVQRRTGEPRV